jgi:hypothetical protein
MRSNAVSLGEISECIDYGVTASAEKHPIGPRFLRITDIQDGRVDWSRVPWCACPDRISEQSRLRPGDIVFARTGATTGKSFLIRSCPDNSVFASYLIRVRLGKTADPGYISHFFQSKGYWSQIAASARGAAQPGVNATSLAALQIPLPPLEEQRRIAAILDASQRISQLHAKRIRGLSALRQSLYRQLASQPGSRLLSLSSLAKITSGYAFKAADFCERGVHIIRMSDLNGEYVDLEGSAKVPPMAAAGLDRFELFEGDILLGMSGSLGKLGIVPAIPAGSRVFLNQRVAKISLAPDSPISRELLIEAIKSKEYLTHLERCAAGVAVRNVSATQMLDCVVPAPAPHEGNTFAEQCRLIGIQMRRSEYCIAQSAALQASLSKGLLGMQ